MLVVGKDIELHTYFGLHIKTRIKLHDMQLNGVLKFKSMIKMLNIIKIVC